MPDSEALLREACAQIALRETEKLQSALSVPLVKAADACCAEHRKTVLALLKKQLARPKSKGMLLLRAAACLLIVCGALSLALRDGSPSPDLRPVSTNHADIQNFYTLSPTGEENFTVPAGWHGEYFPTWLPDTWAAFQPEDGENYYRMHIGEREEKLVLTFTEHASTLFYGTDHEGTEPTQSSYIQCGSRVMMRQEYREPDLIRLVWDEDGHTFCLTCDPEYADQLEKIAESVKKIAAP